MVGVPTGFSPAGPDAFTFAILMSCISYRWSFREAITAEKCMKNVDRYYSISDFEKKARKRMPRCVAGYVGCGTEDDAPYTESLAVMKRIGFRHRGLQPVEQRSSEVSLFGQTYAMPVRFAPTGFSAIVMHECDLALATVAMQTRIPFVISGAS